MLSDNNAIATVAVKNLEESKKFYERTLGLTKVMTDRDLTAVYEYLSSIPPIQANICGAPSE